MTHDSSASTREQTPHVSQTTRTATIIDALKRRAQAVLNDKVIDAESRAILRYGLETNDPWLAELVRRAEADERIVDIFDSQTREPSESDFTCHANELDSCDPNKLNSRDPNQSKSREPSEVKSTGDPSEIVSTHDASEVDSARNSNEVDSTHNSNEVDSSDSTFETQADDSSHAKIEAFAEIICRAGNEPAAALLVLMRTFENSEHPKAVANMTKHFAFSRCGELNLYGMVDAQIAAVESELLAGSALATD